MITITSFSILDISESEKGHEKIINGGEMS
jgi:hypothetical protein